VRFIVRRALDGIVVLSGAALLLIFGVAGLDIAAGPIELRLRDWRRPALVLGLALAARLAMRFVGTRPAALAGGPLACVAWAGRRALLAIVIAACAAYLQFHVRIAGGLDSYGYVSTARLIASGRLHEPQPLAEVLPFEHAIAAATPLGHVPALDGRSSVPRFPLGLPLVMALFGAVAAAGGPFFVPLVMSFAALALIYDIVRRWDVALTGGVAAAVVAVDPVFVVSAIQPMSDAPAACWLLAAIWGIQTPGRDPASGHAEPNGIWWGIFAGICAGMAALTRPVLFPAAFVLALVALTRDRNRRGLACAGAVMVFVALQMTLNVFMYGGVSMSGYGTTSHMFELSGSRTAANISNYAKWLRYTGAPAPWLFWPFALMALGRDRFAWELSAIGAAAAAPFLFYTVFDTWAALRFPLPFEIIGTLISIRALSHVADRVTVLRSWRAALLIMVAFGYGIAGQRFVVREDVAHSALPEEKFVLVGEWFKTQTSDRAVVLSSLHSGPIRMYGQRQTVRWDEIPATALRATVDRLVSAGYEPYLALDSPGEPEMFAERFPGELDRAEPVARVRVVTIYRLR